MLQNVVSVVSAQSINANGTSDVVGGLHRYEGVYGILNITGVPTGTTNTLDVYVQGSPDGGTTWQDLVAFRFTTAAAKKMFALSQLASGGATLIAASDGALASGTMVQGPFGDRLRLKWVFAVGDSSGSYTLSASIVPVGGP